MRTLLLVNCDITGWQLARVRKKLPKKDLPYTHTVHFPEFETYGKFKIVPELHAGDKEIGIMDTLPWNSWVVLGKK